MIEFETSFPPSLNVFYKKYRNRIIISKEGNNYIEEVKQIVKDFEAIGKTRVSVSIHLFPPDRRRFDIDNRIKICQDSITKAGLWNDDSQVDELHVYRELPIKPGKCLIKIIKIIDKNA